MQYGGGYDGGFGASQFAGGGFMPSPAGAAENAFGGGFNQQKKPQNQTLRAVTIKQLIRDNAGVDDENYKVDGVEINTVVVVGKVLSVQDTNTRLILNIDDGTGRMDVSQWINDTDSATYKRHEWREGVYLKVVGNLRSFDRKKSINAYSIRTVTDFNEVTYHFMQCIFQHLHLTKGPAPAPGGAPAAAAPTQGYGAPAPVKSFGGPAASVPTQAAAPGAAPMGGSGGNLPQTIMEVYNMPEHAAKPQGLDYNQVMQELQKRGVNINQAQLVQAVQFLVDEGHVYSTIDDNHFKSSNM